MCLQGAPFTWTLVWMAVPRGGLCNKVGVWKILWRLVKVECRGPFYLFFQELDKSWYYRHVAPEVSVGADNLRKAGPAAHSGQIGSEPLLHRSPCTAGQGRESNIQLVCRWSQRGVSVLHDITKTSADKKDPPEPGTCASHLIWLEGSQANAISPESVCLPLGGS